MFVKRYAMELYSRLSALLWISRKNTGQDLLLIGFIVRYLIFCLKPAANLFMSRAGIVLKAARDATNYFSFDS